jgi:hypothetical protein
MKGRSYHPFIIYPFEIRPVTSQATLSLIQLSQVHLTCLLFIFSFSVTGTDNLLYFPVPSFVKMPGYLV